MSVEDLKKALCQKMKEATKERLEAKRPLQANYWLGYAEGLEKALDLFFVFQKDYDLQVHVSRKQLSELINKYPSYRLMSRHPTVREFTDFILLRDDHFEKLKELFEATQK